MAPTLCPPRGIRLSASGSSPLAPPLDDSSATPTMFSRFPSLPTTDRLSLALATERSSSGTPSVTASTPSPTRATPSGFLAFDSAPTPRTPSLSPLAGTSWSRYVRAAAKKLPLPMLRFLHDVLQPKVFATSEPVHAGHETTIHHCPDICFFLRNLVFLSTLVECWVTLLWINK